MTCSLILDISTEHASINLAENVRQALDEGYIGCGIFVYLRKALDYEIDYTVDYEIYLAKLNHCGVCGVSNDWFRSYLFNR